MTHPTERPDVRALLDYLASLDAPIQDTDPASARAALDASLPQADLPMGDVATVADLRIPIAGQRAIPARLFDARPTRGPGPVVVWYHGGGFVTGGLTSHASLCAEAARQLDLPVVLVDYRLAPEAPFPAAQDDAEAAARWIGGSPTELGRTVDALVLAGDSAGGTLAIVTAMALRDRSAAVPVRAHLALYPATDETRSYSSASQFADGYLLTEAGRAWYRKHYQPVSTDVRASPLLADLHGLPPAVVMTAGLDPVRDQGRAYAAKLITAGVPTTYLEAAGNIHAFVLLRQAIPSSQHDVRTALSALRHTLLLGGFACGKDEARRTDAI